MKNESTIFSKAMFVGLAASLLIVFASSVAAESWDTHKSNYDYREAVHYMNNGYSNMGKVVNKLVEDKEKSAQKHFNWALRDFSKAVEYYAKAELPASEKAAIDSLKKGLAALQKAVKDLEKGDDVSAQSNYNAAQNYFALANILVD